MRKVIGIIGAGALGTALAKCVGEKGYNVILWSRNTNVVNEINNHNINSKYLPNIRLPKSVKASTSIEHVLSNSNYVFIAIPSSACKEVLDNLHVDLLKDKNIVSFVKGFVDDLLMHEYLEKKGIDIDNKYVVVSGPSFAFLLAKGFPTVFVAASKNRESAEDVCSVIQSDSVRCLVSDDVVGVEISGILKNIVALITSYFDGLGLGINMTGFVFSSIFSEVVKIAVACGAKHDTVLGPALLGDAITTTFSDLSRNRVMGLFLSKSVKFKNSLKSTFTVESLRNTKIVIDKAKKKGVEIPLISYLYEQIVNGNNAGIIIESILPKKIKLQR